MTNPLKHLLGRCRDQDRLAPDAVEFLNSALFLDDLKNVICPCRIGRQSQIAHQRGPRFVAPIAQQDRPPGAPIGMKFLRNCHQMTHGMFSVWQSHNPLVAGSMFAQRDIFCRAVGKGQVEGGFSWTAAVIAPTSESLRPVTTSSCSIDNGPPVSMPQNAEAGPPKCRRGGRDSSASPPLTEERNRVRARLAATPSVPGNSHRD